MAPVKLTRAEVAKRNSRQHANIIIDNVVYDITTFFDDHPGGIEVLLKNVGQDASKCFHEVGHSDIAIDWRAKFRIAEVVDEDKWEVISREHYFPTQEEPLTLGTIINVWGAPLLLAGIATLIYLYLLQ